MKRFKLKKPDWAALRRAFSGRAVHAGGYSIAAAAFVIAIAVAANLVVNALPTSWTSIDLTGNALYSLSTQTQQLVADLPEEDEVTVYWLVQDGYEDGTIDQLLSRYEDLSDQLKVVKKDPVVYPTFAQQYTDSSIYNNSLIVVCGDRSRYISYYDIYVTDYSSYYSDGSVSSSFAGESELTSAIDYVTNSELPVVYHLTGHGEADLPSGLSDAIASDNLLLEDLSLLSAGEIPQDAAALLIYAPQSDLSESERDLILDYLQQGGRLLLVTDYSEEERPNLDAVTAYYGLSSVDGIVLEGDASRHMQGYNYYLLPEIDTSHEITQPLSGGNYYVLMPIAQGISVSDSLRDSLTVTQLLTTSSDSYSKVAGYNIETYEKEEGDLDGPFALAVAASEPVTTAAEDTQSEESETESSTRSDETQLVWFGSSSAFESSTNEMVAGANYDLFLNALEWMCDQESAISVRAKDLSSSYLTVPSASASLWSAVLIGVLPLTVLSIGAWTMIERRRR